MFSNGQIVVVEMGFGGYLIGIYSLTNLNHTWSNLGICFASVSEWYDAWNCISPNPQFTSSSSSPLGPLVESPKTQYTDKVGRVPLIPNSQRINEVTNPLGPVVDKKTHFQREMHNVVTYIFRSRCIMDEGIPITHDHLLLVIQQGVRGELHFWTWKNFSIWIKNF